MGTFLKFTIPLQKENDFFIILFLTFVKCLVADKYIKISYKTIKRQFQD